MTFQVALKFDYRRLIISVYVQVHYDKLCIFSESKVNVQKNLICIAIFFQVIAVDL